MRYVVEFELQSDLGNAIGEAIQTALAALGGIANLSIAPVRTYIFNVDLNPLGVGIPRHTTK